MFGIFYSVSVFYVEPTGGTEGGSDQAAGRTAETDGCDWLVPQSHDP